MRNHTRLFAFLATTTVLLLFAAQAPSASTKEIIDASGVKGGLAVVFGSSPELLSGFGKGWVVQALETDAGKVRQARSSLRRAGRYGPITVKHWTAAHLPYADGVVNLIVASPESRVASPEIRRVLAPGGVAVTDRPELSDPTDRKLTKPVPDAIDEWTHYLHGPDNNAVAEDSVIGPPRCLKWSGGPKYSRNHEIDSSVVAVVSAQGRFFYVVDEGLPGFMGKVLPQTWALVARDAFSGVILWKRAMPDMGWTQWKPVMADVNWAKLVAQRRLIPITLPRRVVAAGDRLFAVLSYHAPLTVMDAVTGETLRTVEGTKGTDEILHLDGRLILAVRPRTRGSQDRKEDALKVVNRNDKLATNHPGTVMAVDPGTGGILWQAPSEKLLPLSLTAGGERVFYHTGTEAVCLNVSTGKELWRVPNSNAQSFRWNVQHTLIVHDDVFLIGTPKKLQALSAESGELLWEGKGGRSGFAGSNPVNLYVINGLVWAPAGHRPGSVAQGRDLRTGDVKRTVQLPDHMYTLGHHFRCYRGKATERYLLENKRGIEMIDLRDGEFVKNDWVRGMCRYGILPSNGMIYSTPTPCSCYEAALLTGFNALTTEGVASAGRGTNPLEKGPAFAEVGSRKSEAGGPDDWPCFRRDNRRTGVSDAEVGPALAQKWHAKLSGKLTQPVVVDGKLFVASVDEHTVHALDAGSGEPLWSFTAGGRVDSPPTWHSGRLFFGSANGWLYSLRASDGELAWRYRVAPGDDQIVSYNQLESAWPLRGSALVVDGVVYAAAGRNTYLNDGIFLVGLDAHTGKKLHEAHLKNGPQDPATDKSHHSSIDGAKLDVLCSDGAHIWMRGTVFDKTLKRVPAGSRKLPGIYASAGFIDDLAWNRNAWRFGASVASLAAKKGLGGKPHTGQLLVHDDRLVYGVKYFLDNSGQSAVFYPGRDGYKLFAHRVSEIGKKPAPAAKAGKKGRGAKKKGGKTASAAAVTAWECMLPVRIRAMTKAGNMLYVAGPPDVVDPDDPMAAFEGRKGAVLRAFSADSGQQLAEIRLSSPPVFDGLIAANGKLFMSTADAGVICLAR